MTVTLSPNQAPAGTRKGSPITIVDTFTTNGQTTHTAAFPIPPDAKPVDPVAGGGDVMLAFFAYGGNVSPNHQLITSFDQSPISFDFRGAIDSFNPSSHTSAILVYSHVVQPGDPGTVVNVRFPAANFVSWGLIVYTLRFVDTVTPIDRTPDVTASAGDVFLAGMNAVSPASVGNAFLLSAITASGGAANVGLGAGALPGWYGTTDAVNAIQPNFGMVSGYVDLAWPATWLGASCNWSTGPFIVVSFAAAAVLLRPVPAPGAPSVTMSPSGSSIDLAGVSGVLPTVSWNYTPARGQGPQNGWGIARQRHTVGDMVGFWNFDTNAWQSSEYINYGTRSSFTFPTGAWVNDGTNWDLFVFIQESALNYLSPLSTAQTFVASPPTATVTVTGPTGTTALPKPAVTWTRSLGSGATQAFYRVKVFTQAQTLAGGFDPNVTVPVVDSTKTAGSVLTWTLSKALVPGIYVAYAQLTTNFGQATLWTAGAAFTVAYSQPTAAGVTALVGAGP